MKKYFFFVITLLYVTSIFSQTITVKEEFTSKPLQDVYVYCYDPVVSAVTNINGQCDISEFVDCDSIIIELIGYEKEFLSFSQLKDLEFVVYLSEKYYSEKQIVVSATRWQQEKQDVPNKITTVRTLEMQLQNPQTAADLIGLSDEVFIQKSQLGGGSPMIRGFSANRVLISVDGVRMNNAIFRSGNLQNIISIDPFSVEKTEILFGPGSVIYGSDAIGGTMSFLTLTPAFLSENKSQTKGNIASRFSSANNEKTGHIDFRIGFEKWAMLSSITLSDYDNLQMGSDGPDSYLRNQYVSTISGIDTLKNNINPKEQLFTGYDQINLMQKIRFKPNSDWEFNYGFFYSKSSNVPRYDRLIESSNSGLKNAEWYYGPQLWIMHHFSLDYSGINSFFDKIKLSLAYQHFEESRHDRKYKSNTIRHRYESIDAINVNIDFQKNFREDQKIYYGFEVISNVVGSKAHTNNIITGQSGLLSTRYPDNSKWNSYAAYFTYQNKLNKNLILHSGLRYNQISLYSKFESTFYPFPFSEIKLDLGAFTGSLGFVYLPKHDWEFRINMSSGFRAPNIDDISKVFDSEPGAVVVPNPHLKSEYAYNIDFGFAKTFSDLFRIDFTAFYSILENAMVKRSYNFNGMDSIYYDGIFSKVQAIQNAAVANIYGFQAGVEIKLPQNLSFLSKINYQKGTEELDNGDTSPLRHAAPLFGSAHLIYKPNNLKFDLYSIYNGEISFQNLALSEQDKPHLYAIGKNGNPYSPAWYTLNVKIYYRITDVLSINFGIENILDKRYRSYSSGIAAPGINFIGAINYSF